MPRRTRGHVIADRAIHILRARLPSEWISREQSHDYGIDLEVEFRTGSEFLEGEVVKLQVKGHESIRIHQGTFRERVKTHTALYWLRLRMPIFLVSVDCSTEDVYCVDAVSELRKLRGAAFEKKHLTIPISGSTVLNDSAAFSRLRAKALFDYDWRTTAQFFLIALDRLPELGRLVAWLDRCDRWMLLSVEDARRLRDFRRFTYQLARAVNVDTSRYMSWEYWQRTAQAKGYPADEEPPYEVAAEAGWETLTLFIRALRVYQERVTESERGFWISAAHEVFRRWFDAMLPNPSSVANVQQYAFEQEAL